MKITKLRTQVVEFPYDPVIELSPGAFLRTGSCVLTFLESDQGVIGEGLVYTFNGTYTKIYEEIIRGFGPVVEGQDPLQAGALFRKAWDSIRTLGQGGPAVNAIAALDMALWDLRAKLANVNVAALIGACHTSLPVYDSGSYWVMLTPEQLQKNAETAMKRGFRAFKLRVTDDVAREMPRVKAMKEVIGPNGSLLVDLNQRSSVAGAIRFGRALEEFNLTWFEEPLPYHDHHGEAQVAAAIDTPMASGESVYTSRGILDMLKVNACDIVMPDLQHMGGPTEWLKAAHYAEAFNAPCSNHCYTEMSAALLAATPNASWLEYMLWLEPIYRERIEVKDGRAAMPAKPGWGFSFDPHAIKRYASTR
jgi:L-alanine-DL-glutamate epimerase-like enolase superfamily enzyme